MMFIVSLKFGEVWRPNVEERPWSLKVMPWDVNVGLGVPLNVLCVFLSWNLFKRIITCIRVYLRLKHPCKTPRGSTKRSLGGPKPWSSKLPKAARFIHGWNQPASRTCFMVGKNFMCFTETRQTPQFRKFIFKDHAGPLASRTYFPPIIPKI